MLVKLCQSFTCNSTSKRACEVLEAAVQRIGDVLDYFTSFYCQSLWLKFRHFPVAFM
jgi:hypothetical protein